MQHGFVDQRLYGRNREIEFLRDWYAATRSSLDTDGADHADDGAPPILLLGGGRGVGKRAVVRSLSQHVEGNNGVFLSGRFYPSQIDRTKEGQRSTPERPLSAVWDALDQVFATVHNQVQARALKVSIASEFTDADDVEMLMGMMKSSRRWFQERRASTGRRGSALSEQSDVSMTVPFYVKNERMLNKGSVALAVRFLRVLSTCLPRVVLCLEHLEYADSATFELIDDLYHNAISTVEPIQLVATYREDASVSQAMKQLLGQATEVAMDQSQPRSALANSKPSSRILKVQLDNLSWDDVYQWTVDRFHRETLSEDILQSIVDIIYEKSAGNPQFGRCLLECMAWNLGSALTEATLNELQAVLPDNANDLFAFFLQQQEPDILGVVEVVAALGECRGGQVVNIATLDVVLRRSSAEHVAAAQTSEIFDSTVGLGGPASFPCSEFQTVAYSMIPESRRVALHLKIGRRLWKQSSSESTEDALDDEEAAALLFLGSQNLQRSMDLVTDMGELDTIAKISIDAGKRAMETSRFPLAAFYFELAISALRDRLWKAEWYEISLALYNGVSEAYYCSADFVSVERSLDVVFQSAATFQDKLQAYTTLVYAHSAQHRLDDALNVAAQVLREAGEKFPSNPSSFDVLMEYFKIRRLFRGKSDRFFLNLPSAKDPNKVTAMRMMSFTSFTAYLVHPNLSLLMIFRLLRATLKYGLTGPAMVAFASYAYVLSIHMGRIEEGTRFGKLAMSFAEEHREGHAWLPRISFTVQGLLHRTAFPFQESLEPLRRANRLALQAGDMEGSMFIGYAFVPLLFHMGTPLGLVEEELRSHTKLMDGLGQQLALTHLVPMWQTICDLLGSVPSPLNLDSEITDTNTAIRMAKDKQNKMALEHYYVYRTIYHCLIGEYGLSICMAKKSRETHSISEVWLIFFEGLSSLAVAQTSVRLVRQRLLSVGRKAVKAMKHFCHDNFGSKSALLEAEIAALKGNTSKALSLYNTSIKLAKKQGFLLEEGLAYERLAIYQTTLGSHEAAVPYYNGARRAYDQWGAQTLVTRMDEQLQALGQCASQLFKPE